jgi:glycyl-tRNA synthetase
VLIATGKHADYARKVARQFYQQRGIENPALLGERAEEVKDTTRYNPENGSLLTEPRPFNLMLKTYVGPVESEDNKSYLRPETAHAIFVQFKNTLDVSRQKVPFGICQIGKAFRNEINPRNFTFRSREFEQAELEFFCHPAESEKWFEHWKEERIRFHRELGFADHQLRVVQHTTLAHYAKAAVDLEFLFPFGWQEIEGIHDRGSYDLGRHAEFSGRPASLTRRPRSATSRP